MNLSELARKHVEAFDASKGKISTHADYMSKNFTEGELNIGARRLMQDSGARAVLFAGFKKRHGGWRYSEKEAEEKIVRQINSVRASVMGMLMGELDD